MSIEQRVARFDAIVIGGSYAGLSAALQLARARREVLIVDAGIRRNRFADHSHGFLGQDGRPPQAIAEAGRTEVLAYPTVRWLPATATQADGQINQFTVAADNGERFQAQRLVLATGVVDELPDIDGLAERWGRSVYHCPYCHGYELNAGRIGVIAAGPVALHHALMLPDWGQVTLFTNGSFSPDDAQRAALSARGVAIELVRVRRIEETATVQLDDGRRLRMDGLFTQPRTRMASALAEQIGCALDEGPMGPFIRTDAVKETTVPGVFACGDAARATGNVALSVGDGAQAGVSAHRSLMFG